MKLRHDINLAKSALDRIERALDEQQQVEALDELVRVCRDLDEHYENTCNELDRDAGDPEGTHYKGGWNMEFYIESFMWHRISLALRKLK